jgi:hypothetical protein
MMDRCQMNHNRWSEVLEYRVNPRSLADVLHMKLQIVMRAWRGTPHGKVVDATTVVALLQKDSEQSGPYESRSPRD